MFCYTAWFQGTTIQISIRRDPSQKSNPLRCLFMKVIQKASTTVNAFASLRLLLRQVGRTQAAHRMGECSRVLPSKYVLIFTID